MAKYAALALPGRASVGDEPFGVGAPLDRERARLSGMDRLLGVFGASDTGRRRLRSSPVVALHRDTRNARLWSLMRRRNSWPSWRLIFLALRTSPCREI